MKLWDDNREDGDSISLYLNGQLLLEHYRVTKEPKEISIPLTQTENMVVMVAENLGSTPPNTAALTLIDGEVRKTVVLKSDMGTSEAIKITRKR